MTFLHYDDPNGRDIERSLHFVMTNGFGVDREHETLPEVLGIIIKYQKGCIIVNHNNVATEESSMFLRLQFFTICVSGATLR